MMSDGGFADMEQHNGMSVTPLLELRDVHKKFPGVHALKGVSFNLKPGEVHALIGENGAGKSTLIKIIAGVYDFEGTYLVEGQPAQISSPSDAIAKGVAVIYQEFNIAQDLSIAENIFFGALPHDKFGRVRWKELYRKTSEYLEQVGLHEDPRKKMRFLTVAKQQMVEIAKALSRNAKVVIMDEPTSALCGSEIENLFALVRKMKSRGVGIIYVSHKLEEITELADRVTVFRDGAYIGTDPIAVLDEKAMISKMVGRELTNMFPKRSAHRGKLALEVKNLSTHKVFNVSFAVHEGEIVGFAGLMGAGRTEMTHAVLGVDHRMHGDVSIYGVPLPPNSPVKARKMGVGLVPEDRKKDGIFADLSVSDNMSIVSLDEVSKFGVIHGKDESGKIDSLIRKLTIRTPSARQKISKLSGGNQQKVILARWLLKKNLKVLIIDEPTRGIDVGAKAEIYSILNELAQQGLAIVVVSSEMPEVMGVCDRIYIMAGGTITNELQKDEFSEETILSSCIDIHN